MLCCEHEVSYTSTRSGPLETKKIVKVFQNVNQKREFGRISEQGLCDIVENLTDLG